MDGLKFIKNVKKKLINYVAYCHRFVSYTNRLKKLLEKKL